MSCVLFEECLGRQKSDVVSGDFLCPATAMRSAAREWKDCVAGLGCLVPGFVVSSLTAMIQARSTRTDLFP